MNKKSLLIIGAGGHGRVVADIATRTGTYEKIAFLDDAVPAEGFPYAYLGKCETAGQYLNGYALVVAIGNCAVRKKLMQALAADGARFATVIAPDAVIAPDVTIGAGSVICPGVVANTGARIGQGVIVNTCASVDHDCVIENFCHVAVGARVCGTVQIGEGTWIGAGATVINNLSICPACMIGAGAVVVKDIQTAGTYVGVPARRKDDTSDSC